MKLSSLLSLLSLASIASAIAINVDDTSPYPSWIPLTVLSC
jgi:hypothetical protein